MAKSKSGGTRSYIRGRVGADVYSIGRDAKGAKQQVVRSLAETVANPQTIAQMRGRMIMSTVMQAVSAMRPIIDHSFDNVPAGQPCISEFISRNYALIKADVEANPASGNQFALVAYQEKGIQSGKFVVSDGEILLPSAVTFGAFEISIAFSGTSHTVGDLKTLLGLGADDYITLMSIQDGGENGTQFLFCRLHIKAGVADTTVIESANISTVFDFEGNWTPTLAVLETGENFKLRVDTPDVTTCDNGVIVSYKTTSGYKHTPCTLKGSIAASKNADVILPSYPVGTAMFLNGGEI